MTYGEYRCRVVVRAEGECGLVAESKEDAERYVRRDPSYCLYGTIAEKEPIEKVLRLECWLEEPYE